MSNEDDRLKAARALLRAIEQGDRAALLAAYAENAVQIEHPNRLKSNGDRRSPARMAEDLARGKTLLRSERYDVLEATVMGDQVALQVRWTGILDVALGALQSGDSMICESGIFLKFQGDKIIEQHNYDCFEDFLTPRS